MTRINCIPIEELTREHCFAEYREMPRARRMWPRKKFPGVKNYRMGTGHVLFFADKGAWLEKRHQALYDRLVGHFGYDIVKIPILKLNHWPPEMMNDWEPDEDAMRISRERIEERLNKPLTTRKRKSHAKTIKVPRLRKDHPYPCTGQGPSKSDNLDMEVPMPGQGQVGQLRR